jgi:hypothetical protein
MKLLVVRLVKTCLNETYCNVRKENICLTTFLIQNGVKEGNALLSLLFLYFL